MWQRWLLYRHRPGSSRRLEASSRVRRVGARRRAISGVWVVVVVVIMVIIMVIVMLAPSASLLVACHVDSVSCVVVRAEWMHE